MKDDFYHIEEHFHAQDRKGHRKDRKNAQVKDRSKYKKSDQDQIKKRLLSSSQREELPRGRVLSVRPEGVFVEREGKTCICQLRGSLKQDKNLLKNLIAVGDFVRFSEDGTIALVEERKSVLSRADNLSQRKQQLIAVNIDQVLITMSVIQPTLKPSLIDRYIIATLKGGMQPILLINKIDLLDAQTPEAKAEKLLFNQVVATYEKLKIPLFSISTFKNVGIEELKASMRGRSSVFSGQSGVGKSSLINAILGTSLSTGEVVARTRKGSHTTTSAQLLSIEGGGFCIDTPGIKSFGVWDLTRDEVRHYFSEILETSANCRYPDCYHLQEPGCAVKDAVEKGDISSLRFESYCALMTTLREQFRSR